MKTVISTPFPLLEETAAELGVPQGRVRWLSRLMHAIREGRDVHAFLSPATTGRRIDKATKKKINGSRGRARKA